ncbi:hypothetical protein [Enterobacter hormaechei]|uniref:bestrophin-like domain n=1 Tax=Enterobacter hormaechei TaxID=158836 RepID=UPI0032D9F30A
MSLFYFLSPPSADNVLLLILSLVAFVMAAYAGRTCMPGEVHEETDVIPGAVVSLAVLLTAVVFLVALDGYTGREQAQVREAQAAGRVWQYTGLLPQAQRSQAAVLLGEYLELRIRFYHESSGIGARTWMRLSQDRQMKLWHLAEDNAMTSPSPVAAKMLDAFSGLDAALQGTQAVWRRHIPDVIWAVLLLFAVSASFITGYQYRGMAVRPVFVLILPCLLSMSLFMVAETDLPGEGIIRVQPAELEWLAEQLPPAGGITGFVP